MKTLFRIWYAITAGVVLAFVALYAIGWRNTKYNVKYGQEALLSESIEDRFLFFYETEGIHSKDPVAVLENDLLEIRLYEINLLDFNEEYKSINYIKTYLYPIIIDKENSFEKKGQTLILNFISDDVGRDAVEPYIVRRYFTIDLFSIENLEGGFLIPVITNPSKEEQHFDDDKDLLPRNFERLELYQEENQEVIKVFLNKAFTLTENDLIIRKELNSIMLEKIENQEALRFSANERESLQNKNIYFQEIHDSSEFNYILYIVFGIYFVALIVSAYFVFFYKRKDPKLGKLELTDGFKEYRAKEYEQIEEDKKKDEL